MKMNGSNMNVTDVAPTKPISYAVQLIVFVLFSTFVLPSLLCFLLNFYYFICFRVRLIFKTLHYHFIICLLISDFSLIVTQVPLMLINLYIGSIPEIPQLCTFWIYCTYTLFCVSDFLTMFASIQRYSLVFHKVFYMKWKVFTHYSTLLFCCLYPPISYMFLNLFYPSRTHTTILSPCVEEPVLLTHRSPSLLTTYSILFYR
jgi:hypothetical protein